mmetsp:Transcript_20874/g.54525  ORF Transcript_20874/g.54525 Transcript_20874/m.54525 type:complete len:313 (+) Transcript_20874:172-1110(+)
MPPPPGAPSFGRVDTGSDCGTLDSGRLYLLEPCSGKLPDSCAWLHCVFRYDMNFRLESICWCASASFCFWSSTVLFATLASCLVDCSSCAILASSALSRSYSPSTAFFWLSWLTSIALYVFTLDLLAVISFLQRSMIWMPFSVSAFCSRNRCSAPRCCSRYSSTATSSSPCAFSSSAMRLAFDLSSDSLSATWLRSEASSMLRSLRVLAISCFSWSTRRLAPFRRSTSALSAASSPLAEPCCALSCDTCASSAYFWSRSPWFSASTSASRCRSVSFSPLSRSASSAASCPARRLASASSVTRALRSATSCFS